MNIATELDEAMKRFRVGGISQPDLAKLSGVPQPTISRTLKGKSVPETNTLIKLAQALKCTLGGYTGNSTAEIEYQPSDKVTELKAKEHEKLPEPLEEILQLAKSMTRDGQFVLLGRAQEVAMRYSDTKANLSSS